MHDEQIGRPVRAGGEVRKHTEDQPGGRDEKGQSERGGGVRYRQQRGDQPAHGIEGAGAVEAGEEQACDEEGCRARDKACSEANAGGAPKARDGEKLPPRVQRERLATKCREVAECGQQDEYEPDNHRPGQHRKGYGGNDGRRVG